MNLMNFTFWTVSLYFFRNVHGFDQLCIKETYTFLYFMTFKPKRVSIARQITICLFYWKWNLGLFARKNLFFRLFFLREFSSRKTLGIRTIRYFCMYSIIPKWLPSGSSASAHQPIPGISIFGTTILPPKVSTFLLYSSTDSTEM